MSIEVTRFLFDLSVVLFATSMACFVVILMLHAFVPKTLLQTYFKPPHFSSGEVVALSGFPLGYIRTVMFMRVVAFPNSGKRRTMTKAYELAPPWFRLLSKITSVTFLLATIPLIGLLLLFAVVL